MEKSYFKAFNLNFQNSLFVVYINYTTRMIKMQRMHNNLNIEKITPPGNQTQGEQIMVLLGCQDTIVTPH